MKNILKQEAKFDLHGRTKAILAFIDKENLKNKQILNIGCGFGWFEHHMLDKEIEHIWGIDLTEEDIKTAKEGVTDKRVTFQIGDTLNIPFENEFFDFVVAWDVIEHIPKGKEARMIGEISRVLKKEGKVYITTPYASFLGTMLDPAWWLIGHRHYSCKKIRDVLQQKFHVETIDVKGGIWDIISLLNMYISKWILRRRPLFEEFFYRKVDEEYLKGGGQAQCL